MRGLGGRISELQSRVGLRTEQFPGFNRMYGVTERTRPDRNISHFAPPAC